MVYRTNSTIDIKNGLCLHLIPGISIIFPIDENGFKTPDCELGAVVQPIDELGKVWDFKTTDGKFVCPLTQNHRLIRDPEACVMDLICRHFNRHRINYRAQIDQFDYEWDDTPFNDGGYISNEDDQQNEDSGNDDVDDCLPHDFGNTLKEKEDLVEHVRFKFRLINRLVYFDYKWTLSASDFLKMMTWKTQRVNLEAIAVTEYGQTYVAAFLPIPTILFKFNGGYKIPPSDESSITRLILDIEEEISFLRRSLAFDVRCDVAKTVEVVILDHIYEALILPEETCSREKLGALVRGTSACIETYCLHRSCCEIKRVKENIKPKVIDLILACTETLLSSMQNRSSPLLNTFLASTVDSLKLLKQHMVYVLTLNLDNESEARVKVSHSIRVHGITDAISDLIQQIYWLGVRGRYIKHSLWTKVHETQDIASLLAKDDGFQWCSRCHFTQIDENGNFVILSSCDHVFCAPCILRWMLSEYASY